MNEKVVGYSAEIESLKFQLEKWKAQYRKEIEKRLSGTAPINNNNNNANANSGGDAGATYASNDPVSVDASKRRRSASSLYGFLTQKVKDGRGSRREKNKDKDGASGGGPVLTVVPPNMPQVYIFFCIFFIFYIYTIIIYLFRLLLYIYNGLLC